MLAGERTVAHLAVRHRQLRQICLFTELRKVIQRRAVHEGHFITDVVGLAKRLRQLG